MKKKISAIFMALLLTIALCVPAAAADGTMDYVIDLADLLTYEEWEALEDRAEAISEENGCGVYIVTVEDYTEYGTGSAYDVTTQIFNSAENDFGYGAEKDGIMLLLSMAERDYALFVHGSGAEYAFNAEGQAMLENHFLPNFAEDDWVGGFRGYLDGCAEYLALAAAGEPVQESPVTGVLMAIGISCLLSLLICLALKSKMKTVHRKAEAQTYVAGGLQMRDRYERFTHTTETRRRIQTESHSESGGGGSGRSGSF